MTSKRKLAVITGAIGGIGSAFARQLAARKYDLLLTDVDSISLHKISQELKIKHNIDVAAEAVDLSNENQLRSLTARLMQLENIEILVNCAGFGEGEMFYKEKLERQLKMIQVHITATVHLTHAILPKMVKNKSGKIITVSSISAFIPSPGSSIYAATKSFLNSFMESIHMEVSQYGIQVQSLCPGITRTGFHSKLEKEGKRSSLNKPVPKMETDEVVRLSLKCLSKGKVICVPGCFNKAIKKTIPLLPRKSFYSLSKQIAEKNL